MAIADRKVLACIDCQHFYITPEPLFWYGCRAFGFKKPAVADSRGSGCIGTFVPAI